MSVRAEVSRKPAGHESAWHDHPEAQLIVPRRGVLRLETMEGVWTLPPLRGLWTPTGLVHRTANHGYVELLSVYVTGDSLKLTPRGASLVGVTPLMREIMVWLAGNGRGAAAQRAGRFFLDLITVDPGKALHLPAINDPALTPLANGLRADPADRSRLAQWAGRLAMSPRTLAHRITASTGLSFSRYREQVRLHAAIESLVAGASVGEIARKLAYPSDSAFIAAFRRAAGTTPGRYLRSL